MLYLRLHHHLDVANAIFAGVWLISFGLLVYKSRFLGVWLMIGCLGWLAFCFAWLLYPGTEGKVFGWIQPLTFREVVAMFWLLVVGTRAPAATLKCAQGLRRECGGWRCTCAGYQCTRGARSCNLKNTAPRSP